MAKKQIKRKDLHDYTIVQANDLIRNKKNFSLWELRVFALLASHVKKEDDDFQTYRFKIRDLLDLFETNSNNLYEELKNIPEKLHSKVLKIPYTDKNGKKRLRRYNLISMSDVPNEEVLEDGEYIELRFDKDLKPLMLKLGEHFTVYKFYNILKLRSPYVFQLYELLKSMEYKGNQLIEVSLEELIEILQIPNSYRYGNIRQRILDPARKQFKKYTDIMFDYHPVKGRGGRVVKLRFQIWQNSKSAFLSPVADEGNAPSPTPSLSVFDELYPLVKHWIDEKTFAKLLRQQSEQQVRRAIDRTIKRLKKGDEIHNVAGHIIALSKQATLFDGTANKQAAQQSRREERRLAKQRRQDLENQKRRLQAELVTKEDAIIEGIFLEQPDARDRMIKVAKNSRFSSYQSQRSEEENLSDNRIFRSAFRNVVKKEFAPRFEALSKEYKSKLKSVQVALGLL